MCCARESRSAGKRSSSTPPADGPTWSRRRSPRSRCWQSSCRPRWTPTRFARAVREVIAGGAKEMGKVMGQVVPRFKGRADGKVINQIVREELQAG